MQKNLAGFILLDLEIVVHPQYAICQPSTTIGCSTSDETTARTPREAALTPVQYVEPGRLSGRPTSSTIMPGGHIRARCPRPAGRMTQGLLTRTRGRQRILRASAFSCDREGLFYIEGWAGGEQRRKAATLPDDEAA